MGIAIGRLKRLWHQGEDGNTAVPGVGLPSVLLLWRFTASLGYV